VLQAGRACCRHGSLSDGSSRGGRWTRTPDEVAAMPRLKALGWCEVRRIAGGLGADRGSPRHGGFVGGYDELVAAEVTELRVPEH
jgi:hypothetical protein